MTKLIKAHPFLRVLFFFLCVGVFFFYTEKLDSRFYVYAVEYGRGETPFKQDSVGPENDKGWSWFFWVIRHRNEIFLVDTGFEDSQRAKAWGIKQLRSVPQLLNDLKLSPGEIDHIILTHGHWDHVGNLALFPKAKVWMQQEEFDFMEKSFEEGEGIASRRGYLKKDFEYLVALKEKKQLHLLQGNERVADKIQVHLIPGHTPGSQVIEIATREGNIFLMSDAVRFYKDFEAFPQEKIQKGALWVPGHDPEVFDRFFNFVHPAIVRVNYSSREVLINSKLLFNQPKR